jgi:hypothetical protein
MKIVPPGIETDREIVTVVSEESSESSGLSNEPTLAEKWSIIQQLL